MQTMAPDLSDEADAFYESVGIRSPDRPDLLIIKMVIAFRC